MGKKTTWKPASEIIKDLRAAAAFSQHGPLFLEAAGAIGSLAAGVRRAARMEAMSAKCVSIAECQRATGRNKIKSRNIARAMGKKLDAAAREIARLEEKLEVERSLRKLMGDELRQLKAAEATTPARAP